MQYMMDLLRIIFKKFLLWIQSVVFALLMLGFLFGKISYAQTDLLLTGVIDGPLSGGLPKAVEFYALSNITDLSKYGFGSANNGGGSNGQEFTFPAVAVSAGTFLFVATEVTEFTNFFGFAPDYTSGAANINGDDAIELFMTGSVVDIFGDINTDGTGQPWEYMDGWAYRIDATGPDGLTFILANWKFSGINALDNTTSNATAPVPFPNGSFKAGSIGDSAPGVSATSPANDAANVAVTADIEIKFTEDVAAADGWFGITGSASGSHTATISGGPQSFILNPEADFANNETVTVTITAGKVSDLDSTDPPDSMQADFVFTFTTKSGISGILINEIFADPATDLTGDANGDGTRDSSADEFVEIVNNSGSAIDISGWTLSDGVGVRHVFPDSTILDNLCPVVVFGGGTPTGTFGHALVQTASTGALGLNNGGDPVILNDGISDIAAYVYGAEGGDDQSLTRDPDITGPEPLLKHSTATGANGALFSPGTQVDGSLFPGCQPQTVPLKEIFEIQGGGLASSFAGQTIKTENNIVTAVGPDGFFMQTPATRTDGDPQTSDGIFVYMGSTPGVTAGDLVDVTGEVAEFFNLTEFSSSPTVVVKSSGNPLPDAVQFDETVPSPSPSAIPDLERFEGMLVEVKNSIATGPTDRFGDTPIVAATQRTFREPGIVFPGLSGLPVWDGNPEVFEIDVNRFGLPDATMNAGSKFSATGGLGFAFGDYQIWPTSLSIDQTPDLPRVVRDKKENEMGIGTLNMLRLFDDQDDGNGTTVSAQEFQNRLSKFSKYIREALKAPDILAVQEVENPVTLQSLADQIKNDDHAIDYVSYLVEGNDPGGIDVGFLVSNSINVNSLAQLHKHEKFTLDNSLLHDRPPLLLDVSTADSQNLKILNLHLRSLSGIDDPLDGDRVRQKRQAQATSVALLVDSLQQGNPAINLVVTGDFNAFEFTDGYADILGQIIGDPANSSEALLPGTDVVEPDLVNEVLAVPAEERYSYIFDGNAQVLDYFLTSQALHATVSDIQYARGNADAADLFGTDGNTALRSSDHDGLVLFLVKSEQPQLVEINDLVSLTTRLVDWDTSNKIFSFLLAVRNESQTSIKMPIVIKFLDINPPPPAITVANADAGGSGIDAKYIYPDSEDDDDILSPGEETQFKEWRIYDPGAVDFTFFINVSGILGETGFNKIINSPVVLASVLATETIKIFKSVDEFNADQIPEAFGLSQNYPNPFNPVTRIEYQLPIAAKVEIAIYNVVGQKIRTLVDEDQSAGFHYSVWDAKDEIGAPVASGVYVYKIVAGGFVAAKKMTLLR